MPAINTLAEVLVQPDWPYHYHYDNLPLKQILLRQEMINAALDANTQILEAAKGNMPDIGSRMDVSLNADGTLKSNVIPVHSIDLVLDTGAITVDSAYAYVKMTTIERAKLFNLNSGATALKISFPNTPIDTIFINELVKINDSSTIAWSVSADSSGNGVALARLITPVPEAQYYNVTPNTLDYQNYSIGQSIVPNSLRVYINGVRIFSGITVHVPEPNISSCTTGCWDTFSYVSADTAGTFQLNSPCSSSYVVRIDYNRSS